MEHRGKFTFYRSFWEAIKGLPKKDRLPILEAIISYALTGQAENELTTKQAIAFGRLLSELDKERRLSAEGRRSTEYKTWRKAVFERDNYTCQCCKKRGVKLNAHHIKSYAYHHDLRFTISNGITLCEQCHKIVHRLIRKGLIEG